MTHAGKELEFSNFIHQKIKDGVKLNKRDTEKFAADFGISDKNAVKELCELAIVFRARELANSKKPMKERYDDIVGLYRSQVNLSHRTSQSVMLQQYSTPAPIAFLAGIYIWSNRLGEGEYFEPSAGNGLLTIALPMKQTTVNEIDEFRSKNLSIQTFAQQLRQDATEPFTDFAYVFEGVITNPPFGKLDKTVTFSGFPINTLDHAMAIRALACMKNSGRAAIIIGGHTQWDNQERIIAGKNRIFFSYLYRHYHVADVINIDGDLYSRQGTSFNVRLILIDGRKAALEGYPPLKGADDKTVKDFETLYQRVAIFIENKQPQIEEIKTVTSMFKNLSQIKQYLKENEGKVFYKFFYPNGNTAVKRCYKVQSNSLVSKGDNNINSYLEWGSTADYEITATGFKHKQGLILDFNVTTTEIEHFEKALQSAKDEENVKEHEKEVQKREAQSAEKYRIKEVGDAFIKKERISNEDFLKLCDLNNIKLPIRTRGYFKNSVGEVWLEPENNTVSYSYRTGTSSVTAVDVIESLRDYLLPNKDHRLRIAKVKSISKLKILNLLKSP